MKKCSQKILQIAPSSFDIWEDGAREMVRNRAWRWAGRTDLPLIAIQMMDVSRRDHRWFRHVNYPFIAVEMILQGEAEYCCEDAPAVRIGPGGYYVVSPGSSVRMVNSGLMTRRKLSLILRGDCLGPISASLGLARDVHGPAADPAWLEHALLELGSAVGSRISAEDLSAKSYRFLLDFSRMRAREAGKGSPIAAALEYMQTHFREKICLADVARVQHCSEVTLRRNFQQVCRMSPHRWLMKLRLEYAAVLLRTSSLPVKEIASDCGWGDVSGFVAAFRERYGMTPSASRKSGKSRF